MASPSIQAAGHRARQHLRPTCAVRVQNVADWVHDVVVTNRPEKRRALAEGKKHRCEMLIKKDDKGEKRTEWRHSKTCPKWKPAEKPEAKEAA